MNAGKHFFRDASIQTKLLASHFLLILLPTVLIVILFYHSLYGLVLNDTIRSTFALSRQGSHAMEAQLSSITAIASSIRSNTFIRQLCTDAIPDETKKDLVQSNAFLRDLRLQLDDFADVAPVTSIHIYTDHLPEGLYDNWLLGDFFLPEAKSRGTYWHGIMAGTTKTALYCPSFYLSPGEIGNYGPLAYIEKLYPNSRASQNSPSYLAVYFDDAPFREILRETAGTGPDAVSSYVIGERQSVVASADPALPGALLIDYRTALGLAAQDSEELPTRRLMGRNVYAQSYQIGPSDWLLVCIIPAARVLHRVQNILIMFGSIYLLTLVIAFFLAHYFSRSITDRIRTVNDQMLRAREELPVQVPAPVIHDEIGELADSYNYMASEINRLVVRQKEDAEELRLAEVRALQAQINPHFLYNTMDMINWLSQTGEREEVTRAIHALSAFYKLTLSKKETMTELSEELTHVSLYMELQNMRYEGRLDLVIDVPEEYMGILLPKLTLQPIVENAVIHGILEKPDASGTIVITAWSEGDFLVILVSDDGVGMDREKLQSILEGTKKSAGSRNNIAVFNTHRRLRILYGENCGLTYRSEPGEGCEVEVRIPMDSGRPSDDHAVSPDGTGPAGLR